MNARVPCRVDGCDHEPLKNAQAERMHFHRVHSRTVIPFREKSAKHNGHAKIRIGTKTGEPDRRTKEWRMANPRLAKALGGRGKRRRNVVDRAMDFFAQPVVKLECPGCHFDLNLLASSKVPALFCPGCGTRFQVFIERLAAIAKA